MGGEERRQFPRFPCRYVAWVDGPRGPMKGLCVDLSMGGAFIEGITQVQPNALVDACIDFPHGYRATFKAQVRRVDGTRGIGLQFVRLEPAAMDVLRYFTDPARNR